MKQGVLSWSLHPHILSLNPPLYLPFLKTSTRPIRAALEPLEGQKALTARERRQLRNERRESKEVYNWREEVEERLMKKPKKVYKSWTEELNLDNLALLGPQWWVVRVSRVSGQDTAERMARALVRNFPDFEFKVYSPATHVKRKLKNGSVTVKPKPLFPGCTFLNCVMNREIHDFIRECDGVGGFIGSKVGNIKRQINKPRPVSSDDMEAIFRQAKEEQEKADRAFEEEHPGEREPNLGALEQNSPLISTAVNNTSKPKRRSKKASEPLESGPSMGELTPGSTVRVVSGAFAEFSGIVMKLDIKRRMATVGFTVFGKETLADLNVSEIVPETN